MLHAVIIDDEYNGVRSLELIINKFVPEVKTVAVTTNPEEGVTLINSYRPDIVFLDINMPTMNGFELLENIVHTKFHLIFTTAHQEYAIQAIKKSATDYLLKPIDLDSLKACVARILEKVEAKTPEANVQDVLKEIVGLKSFKVPIPTRQSVEYVVPSSILCIEAKSNSSKITFFNMTSIEVNKSLKEYEALLCREGLYFIRVHNSFIVNLNSVIRYLREDGGQIVLAGNKIVPVSKHRKGDFFKSINLNSE